VGVATFDNGLSGLPLQLTFFSRATVSADWLSWLQVATDLTDLTFIIIVICFPA